MFALEVPVWELIVRVVAIYFFVLIGLRMSGKKQIGEMAPFDLVVLLILSETVSQALHDDDSSITAGWILAGTLLLINTGMAWITFKSKKLESFIDGEPQILIHNGKVNKRVADKEKLTHDEILETLRGKNVFSILDVEYAILETNGTMSVKQTRKAEMRKGGHMMSQEGESDRQTTT